LVEYTLAQKVIHIAAQTPNLCARHGILFMIIRPSSKPLLILAIVESAISLAVLISTVMYYPAYLLYAVVFTLLLSLLLVPRAVRLKASRILIEDGKLCYETGILSKSRRTMELRKVQDVRVDQTVSQRMLNMGDITVETAGESSRITMHAIDDPHRAADHILELTRSRSANA
jgi:membrane protein YdbS with pleckstrin-like domain